MVYLQSSGLSGWTVTNKVQSLLAFTRWLHEEEFTEKNVAERVRKPKPPQTQRQPFTDAELRRLLKASQSSIRDAAIVALLLDTAIRASELCTLKLSDCLLDQCLIKVMGKGNKERVVPHSPQTGKLVSKWLLKGRASEGPYVFHTERSERFTPRSLHKLIERIGNRAAVDDCYPHRLRHSAAITMLRNGMDPLTLQRMLGHTSLNMTMRYVALNTTDLQNAHAVASPLANLMRNAR
ncbi:tyrosine-type recombinase/integrase [Truepera radiovictrix]|uniref:tyrosine-type recombinase/integrase n=1 Tax=Truepera radiovictrix TaxID=332249 RepID=UPI002814E5FF|nr:tyrosine-type recombinase/integrase [Truepera radiovictrix]WMT56518.1 tyrosine-type recombinase/integrase [Truepera radiovictrix]